MPPEPVSAGAHSPDNVDPPIVQLPAGWTFAALIAGFGAGWLLSDSAAAAPLQAITGPIGNLWLSALQMTIIPLVASLLVTGITGMVATARAGATARRTLLAFWAVLTGGTLAAAFLTPILLEVFPIPASAGQALLAGAAPPGEVPGIGSFVESLVTPNVVAAAADTAMLPLIVFFVALAFALTRLAPVRRTPLIELFAGLGDAMLVVIGWVLWLAPVGVLALAVGVGLRSGGGALAALAHYILLVSSLGGIVMAAAYVLARLGGGLPIGRFARAVLPAQTVALSTQSSLASLPAMLGTCRALGLRETSGDFVLPLAVALFRATGPAMNLAVAIYVADLAGITLTPLTMAVGVLVALVTTVGSVSLPGAVSFVTAIGPIAIAMGIPVEPLALLVAVEMVPDLMRTVGNVTMDVAVTSYVDRSGGDR
ncbi:cation:dicarboxylase symporter family transporter [Croceibacterium sp. TMG7-5b_MA50]|uniref:dicarboxylate/amino acid:cation symporter n=1 Tax=Croceibacterium sp. TMG7-5b_MA50 TaxID=3121290 RepID=UPI003221D273